ncbi:MAG: cysteine peptidase family C39 domain-containing protein [Erysipelotrichaceae bacterium]
MNCGVACIMEYLRINNLKNEVLVNQLKDRVNKSGISVGDLVMILKNNGISCDAYFKRKDHNYPFIAYYWYQHFVLVLADGRYVVVYDPLKGVIKLSKRRFKCKYSGISIDFVLK